MFSKIRFHLIKIYITVVVTVMNLLNLKWKKVENIYLPFVKSIGFNTLRWIYNGRYECDEIRIIKNKISENDIIIEIGTGLGFVSSYCAKIVGSTNVHTFEANPYNVSTAKDVFKKNNVNPSIYNALLGNDDGTMDFTIDYKSRLASTTFINKKETVSVGKLLLNAQIEKIKPTFLIMDIEGGEYDIFSIINFQSIVKVQFELHPKILDDKACIEIFEILTNNNFIQSNDVSINQNYFFCKKK
jgi:FkbM family methyltransferase